MDKKSKCSQRGKDVKTGSKYQEILNSCYNTMKDALFQAHQPTDIFESQFTLFIDLVQQQLRAPFSFSPYHQKIRSPIDYYQFGLDFIRPLIDLNHSKALNLSIATEIEGILEAGENVILLANHQTEVDPQAISILLENTHPKLAQNIIYLAGERVITDPLAIPFSLGCDLLCIYSKKYIEYPPELRAKKQLHNKHTMECMSRLLAKGGKIFYVAPSGGRDRRNDEGRVVIAPFDPQSIEMMHIMAKKSRRPTHFYPFVLATYDLLPPPETVQIELGEMRTAKFTPIYLSFTEEFLFEDAGPSDKKNRELNRKQRAKSIWDIVNVLYSDLYHL